jgi:hypothetical protein
MKIFTPRLAALIAAVALVAAACGGADAEVPVNDAADNPDISSACLIEEPECDDTPNGDQEPQDLPSSDDGAVDSGGFIIDGGLTIPEALATDATGVIAVKGFLIDDGQEARLCELLAESLPPQCGGSSVVIDSLDQIDPDETTSAGDVTWTDQLVTVLGELIDGTLVTTSLSQ